MMKRWLVVGLLLASVALQAAEPVGRLFSSPSERALLNHVRQTKKEMTPQPVEAAASFEAPEVLELPDAVAVQGYVKRSDGKKGTVWINHQALQENTKNGELTVGALPRKSNRVPIKLNASGKQFSLKAGQSYSPETNQVRESRASVDGSASANQAVLGGIIGDE